MNCLSVTYLIALRYFRKRRRFSLQRAKSAAEGAVIGQIAVWLQIITYALGSLLDITFDWLILYALWVPIILTIAGRAGFPEKGLMTVRREILRKRSKKSALRLWYICMAMLGGGLAIMIFHSLTRQEIL